MCALNNSRETNMPSKIYMCIYIWNGNASSGSYKVNRKHLLIKTQKASRGIQIWETRYTALRISNTKSTITCYLR